MAAGADSIAATSTAAPPSSMAAPASSGGPGGGGVLPGLVVISGQPIPGFRARQPRPDQRVTVATATFAGSRCRGNQPPWAPPGPVSGTARRLDPSQAG